MQNIAKRKGYRRSAESGGGSDIGSSGCVTAIGELMRRKKVNAQGTLNRCGCEATVSMKRKYLGAG